MTQMSHLFGSLLWPRGLVRAWHVGTQQLLLERKSYEIEAWISVPTPPPATSFLPPAAEMEAEELPKRWIYRLSWG